MSFAMSVPSVVPCEVVAEDLAAAGIAVDLAEPAGTAFACGRKRHDKTGYGGPRAGWRSASAQGTVEACL
jgi:hypothetical protein